jgi:hypothetical protein
MSYTLSSTNGNKLLHIRTQDLNQNQFLKANLKTDFQVNLEVPIEVFSNENLGLALHSVSIPFSFFNIDIYSNKFRVKAVLAPIFIDITVPIGNYNIKQLASTVKGLLDIALATTFSIVYSSVQNGLTFIDTLSTSEYEFDFDVDNSIYRQLGFLKTQYTSSSFTLVSASSITLFPYQSIFLHCDLILGDSQDSRGNQADILERIPVLSANSLIYYRPTSTQQRFLVNKRLIYTFRIYLTYDRITPVDTRGLDLEVSLQFLTIDGLSRNLPITERPVEILPQLPPVAVESSS